MSRIESTFFDIGAMDAISRQDTAIHRMDPRIKALTTAAFIVCVVSFGKHDISALVPFLVYPLVLVVLADLPLAYLLRKLMVAAPFAVLIGIFNPLLDQEVLLRIGPIDISGGWVSFFSILLRFAMTVGAALILIATTGYHAVCMALEKMGVPQVFVVQLLFLYRYLFVLVDEASRMVRARSLRSFEGRGSGMKVFGSMAGHLLLRTMDRAQRVHLAMLCRGFDGTIRPFHPLRVRGWEVMFFLGWTGLFVFMRLYNLPRLLGTWIQGFLS
ncbi:MAG: cobalt ECF transporter T component CbiQ [Deltaproteobacteria bacterium]